MCPAGFSGPNCDNNIDDCASKPCKYGTCKDLVNDYKCNCTNGYSGKNCDINLDDCKPTNPCVNGVC